MSEPTRNAEIEDVLLSIRRLVSEGPESRAQATTGDRFVLTQALRINDEPDSADHDSPEDREPPAAEGPRAADETDIQNPAEFGNKVAEFETAVADQDDQWEPDGNIGDEYAGHPVSPFAWSDQESAEADIHTAHDDDSLSDSDTSVEEANAAAADEDPFDRDEAVLDEEALRDLVADILRQELQGALGTRITRNVRKLVRREISRALAEQELE